MKFFHDMNEDNEYSASLVCYTIFNIITLGKIRFLRTKVAEQKRKLQEAKRLRQNFKMYDSGSDLFIINGDADTVDHSLSGAFGETGPSFRSIDSMVQELCQYVIRPSTLAGGVEETEKSRQMQAVGAAKQCG
ncbi:hypothetical protein B1691_05090 [Geobacillus sp. 47C-IIb]|uniref:hypothetical protein n=1 Tax=Geobacillus sp. 47C-IIb TaxID=1963026 RepID=UPI0009BDEC1A|nr:hypothetical protein [Geobacillus sp. 47C-IIb]OQP10545.1 hypothetical protein B1691_05090 [Geobacillus sp. 47C-IIb]QNU32341.1 hypothetical protein IC804_06290 [Geobacillus sp. 47C-IIb]